MSSICIYAQAFFILTSDTASQDIWSYQDLLSKKEYYLTTFNFGSTG
jgi:hypothetical protein